MWDMQGIASRGWQSPAWIGPALCCLLIGAAIAAAPAAAESPAASVSVVNGSQAKPGQFPWMAYITARTGAHAGFSCSGTVVSPYVVLTAGHCVESPEIGLLTPAAAYTVTTGSSDVEDKTTGQRLKVSRAVVSPRFSPFGSLRGDAGLLILKTPTSAPPISLAHPLDAGLEVGGAAVMVAGWGLTSGEAEQAPTKLRWGSTKLQGGAYCRHHVEVPPKRYSESTQLCSFEPQPGASSPCYGDSGGPLFTQTPQGTPVQIGITSFGSAGCRQNSANVFTRVDRLSSWVDGWIAASTPGSTLPNPIAGAPQGPRLPVLFQTTAEELVHIRLAEQFGAAFKNRTYTGMFCERLTESRFYCSVIWEQGRSTFFGSIQVYLVLHHQTVDWADSFAIHRVGTRCSEEPHWADRCPISTRRE